jgi:hypothetical protein
VLVLGEPVQDDRTPGVGRVAVALSRN